MSSALPAILRSPGRTAAQVLVTAAVALVVLVSAPLTTDAHAASRTKISHAASIAANQKGDPYAYGAAGPNRFDCSGLTYYSYRKAGFSNIPRTSSAQAHFAQRIHRSNMRRGDLVFFYDGGGVYHVGVYAGSSHGRRLVLHAPYSGARVRTERIWTDRWFPGTLRWR
jgi:cell wall-associated NlpC family hydrolase